MNYKNKTLKQIIFFAALFCLISAFNYSEGANASPCPKNFSPQSRKKIRCQMPAQPESGKVFRLVDLLDIALTNSPLTEQAWENAKAAAAVIGQEEANYWPFLTGVLSASRQGNTGFSGLGSFFETEYSATAALTWILLDFGTIDYQVCNAIFAFKAARWTYDWTIQTVLLSIFQNYYDYVSAVALYAVQLSNLQDALVVERATLVGHASGVNTITDVLQAKSARLQAQLNVQNQYSTMLITHANLAVAMGINPEVEFTVEGLPPLFKVEKIQREVEQLICQAKYARADLAAQRATVKAFRAALYAQEAAFWPNFTATGFFTETYVSHQTNEESYEVALNMNIPFFSGFSQVEIIRQAKAELMSQKAELRQLELQAFLSVYTAYYTLKTAGVNLVFSKELLVSAQAAYNSALVGYRTGVLNFVDLQNSLVTLQNARATRIQSQTGWFISLAQLAYSLGCLSFPCQPIQNTGCK
jgi:outer membrane protein